MLPTITLRIQLDAKVQDEKRGVLIDDCLSHHIKEAELQDLLQSARRGLWRSNESEGITLGQALYRLLNGSGGELSVLLNKAYATGQTLYRDFGKGNPRLMEWLEQIAGNEAQYNLEQLKAEILGKSDDYIQHYLADIIVETEGEDFHRFLQQASVYCQPVPV